MPVKLKTSDESRNTTITLADDSYMVVALAASTTYFVDALIVFTAGATPDFKIGLAYSSTLTDAILSGHYRNALVIGSTPTAPDTRPWFNAAANVTGATSLGIAGSDTASTYGGAHVRGVIRTNGAGNLSWQWAQAASDGANVTCKAGSYLAYTAQADMPGTLIVKTSQQIKTNDATPGADSVLTFSTAANAQYLCEMMVTANAASNTPKYSHQLHDANVSVSTGQVTKMIFVADGVVPAATQTRLQLHQQAAFLTTPTNWSENLTGDANYNIRTHHNWSQVMDGSGGTFAYEWSQRTSSATQTRVNTPSWLWYEEVT